MRFMSKPLQLSFNFCLLFLCFERDGRGGYVYYTFNFCLLFHSNDKKLRKESQRLFFQFLSIVSFMVVMVAYRLLVCTFNFCLLFRRKHCCGQRYYGLHRCLSIFVYCFRTGAVVRIVYLAVHHFQFLSIVSTAI